MPIIPFKLNPLKNISKAEKIIYQKAINCDLFLNPYVIFFHSLRISEADRKLVGEVDFVFLDCEYLLFLEVKGGKVFYNSSIDVWSTQNGKSNKDPFYQVCSTLFDVRDNKFPHVFKNEGFNKKLIFGYGVLFPDCNLPVDFSKNIKKNYLHHKSECIEYNKEIIYTHDLNENPNGLSIYLNQLKKYWKNYPKYKYHNSRLNTSEVTEIKNYFRRDLIFETPILDLLSYDSDRTKYYTDQQSEMMEITKLNEGTGFLITGGPGTGKTLLALEKTKHLIEEGNKVLFICYNKPLALFLSEKISKITAESMKFNKNGSADVYNLHSVLINKLKKHGVNIKIEIEDRYWKIDLPKLFIDTFRKIENEDLYDYIIIDEGQDIFSELNMECMNSLIKGGFESGNYIIFLDKYYQSVYNSFNEEYFLLFKQIYRSIEFPLNKNCRNTPNIINKAYYDTGMPKTECLKESLLDPETLFYNTYLELINILNNKIKEYLSKNVSPNKITVLTKKELIDDIIATNSHLYTKINYDHYSFIEKKIIVTTPHSFKGLENQIIIFAGFDRYFPEDDLLMSQYYVGYTRATSHLVIILSKTVERNLILNIQKHIAEEVFKTKQNENKR